MPNFVFWLSLPWLLPQALWVRRRTPRFHGPSGELRGVFGEHAQQRIVGIGDSIIAGVGASSPEDTITARLAKLWQEESGSATHWSAHGKIGARTKRIISIAESLEEDDRVTLVLISAGVNDITSLAAVGGWVSDLDALIAALQARFRNARLAILGIPPLDTFPALPRPLKQVFGWRASYFDQAARRYVEGKRGVFYVPIHTRPKPEEFSSDGFHPSAQSYALLACEIVRIRIEEKAVKAPSD